MALKAGQSATGFLTGMTEEQIEAGFSEALKPAEADKPSEEPGEKTAEGEKPKPAEASAEPAKEVKEVTPKPAEEPEAKPPAEAAKPKEKTQAEKDQEYIHKLHMQLAESRAKNELFEKALTPKAATGLTPEQQAAENQRRLELLTADPDKYISDLAKKEVERREAEGRKKFLEEEAKRMQTTPENVEKYQVSLTTMQKTFSDQERYPLMKDENFRKFLGKPETLESILNPMLELTQGQRTDLQVLADPLTWNAAYYQAQIMFSKPENKPLEQPSRKDVALAGIVKPATTEAAPSAKSALEDDPIWKGILKAKPASL